MAAMVLSSVGAFAQQAAGTTTLQPKVGLNVATIGDNDWKAGFAAGAELQYQASSNLGVAVGALYSVQGYKVKDVKVYNPQNEMFSPCKTKCSKSKTKCLRFSTIPNHIKK